MIVSQRGSNVESRVGSEIVLPTAYGEFCARFISFGAQEGVCLVKQGTGPKRLLRVQSSCIFSEAFWAIECDCAYQLHKSLQRIAAVGGVCVYIYEEGRGVGLFRKMEAIHLQQLRGINTKTAFECIGVGPDVREYKVVEHALKSIGMIEEHFVLMSNNPVKMARLKAMGINIDEMLCFEYKGWVEQSALRRRYLEEKARFLGHYTIWGMANFRSLAVMDR